MSSALEKTLDMKTFEAFSELMEDELHGVLKRHLDIAQDYVKIICGACDTADFKAMSEAAHPLKSSSQQIGAMRVANVAREIEQLALSPTPNLDRLKILAEQVSQEQSKLASELKDKIG